MTTLSQFREVPQTVSCHLLLSFRSSDSLHLTGPHQAGISRQRPQGSTQRAPLATHGPRGKGDIENLQEEICALVPLQGDWLKDDARDRNSEMKARPPSTFHSHNLGCTSHTLPARALIILCWRGERASLCGVARLAPCPSHLRWEVAGRAQKGRDGAAAQNEHWAPVSLSLLQTESLPVSHSSSLPAMHTRYPATSLCACPPGKYSLTLHHESLPCHTSSRKTCPESLLPALTHPGPITTQAGVTLRVLNFSTHLLLFFCSLQYNYLSLNVGSLFLNKKSFPLLDRDASSLWTIYKWRGKLKEIYKNEFFNLSSNIL